MGNATPIKYRGEVLALVDPTAVKAVEPYVQVRTRPRNLWQRLRGYALKFVFGTCPVDAETENYTKLCFKDGTWLKLRMPFYEYINEYC